MAESSVSQVRPLNVSEYLELLRRAGIEERSLTAVQPVMQQRIWDRVGERPGAERMAKAIEDLTREDDRFHMEGGSWTNNISWVRDTTSSSTDGEGQRPIAEKVLLAGIDTGETRYRNALFSPAYLADELLPLLGEGRWTDYGKEICRRAMEILEHDF